MHVPKANLINGFLHLHSPARKIAAAEAFACLCVLLLAGCQYDPFASRYATKKPDAEDVAGRYELVKQTVKTQGPVALEGRPCFVELRADGTFTATNVPPWTLDTPGTDFFQSLISGTGTWRIAKVGLLDNGLGKTKTIWGVYLDSKQAKFMPANLTGNKPPHGLIFGLGDPDAGQAMILETAKRLASSRQPSRTTSSNAVLAMCSAFMPSTKRKGGRSSIGQRGNR